MNTSPHLVSINVSQIQTVEHNGKTFRTGIFKKPVRGPVRTTSLGLAGDAQGDKRHHGGVDMALYAYTAENYDFWRREWTQGEIPHGKFGENLTTAGIDEADVAIGDRFRIGRDVEVEVSIPRAPCATFAMAMGDPEFPKKFTAAGRMGFYLRVLREGTIQAGDPIERTHRDPTRLTIAQITHLKYFEKGNIEGYRRALSVPALSSRWREKFEELLAKS